MKESFEIEAWEPVKQTRMRFFVGDFGWCQVNAKPYGSVGVTWSLIVPQKNAEVQVEVKVEMRTETA